jgi:hypothetical protein
MDRASLHSISVLLICGGFYTVYPGIPLRIRNVMLSVFFKKGSGEWIRRP